jgi:bacterioferritin (cytochrome b1)
VERGKEVMSEEMNLERVVKLLGTALSLQVRSPLQYMLFSASMSGFEVQAVAAKLWEFARAELEDTRKLIEKITALGGDPSIDEAPLRWAKTPEKAIDLLIETETQTVEALHAVIPETGQEGRSEALEHLLEHIIMRKQNQIDFLHRVRRES